MGTLANSETSECGVSSGSALFAKIKRNLHGHLNLDFLISDPLVSIMNHPRIIISNHLEEFISK